MSRERPERLKGPRTADSVVAAVRERLGSGELDMPVDTVGRWAALAALGRTDLALARVAEGHVDAVAILAEAGRGVAPGALYGVWASRSGGASVRLVDGRVSGTMRYCSGAGGIDRALVVAGDSLVEVDLADPAVVPDRASWQAIGMDASASADVRFEGVAGTVVGSPGWYASRAGFLVGGGGVAAVWLGGAAGVLDDVLDLLAEREPDEHQLAHVGALHAAVEGAAGYLERVAHSIDDGDVRPVQLATCRTVAERAAWETLDRVPRVVGPTPLSRDRVFAQRLVDLQLYVRQHHAERDLAALGRAVLEAR
nr:acyl-CoA dehydrogenase family protein [Actinokineospora terrae]